MGNIVDSEKADNDKHVLKKTLGGGPLNLGDPDDRTLRVIERDVIVSKMIRERVRNEKCKHIADELDRCGSEAGLAVVYKCTKERDALLECSGKWFRNEELRNECTEEYLRQRSYYRRTGKRGYEYSKDDVSQKSQQQQVLT